MIFRAKRKIDKTIFTSADSLSLATMLVTDLERELCNKLSDELSDGKIHAVRLPKYQREENPEYNTITYSQDLYCITLPQCKNCVKVYPWCARFKNDFGGTGFCPYGREI